MVKKGKTFRYKSLIVILAVFLAMGFVIFIERSGIPYEVSADAVEYLDNDQAIPAAKVATTLEKTCLVLTNGGDPNSQMMQPQFEQIMLDMKIGYDLVDVSQDAIPPFDEYETVAVLLSFLSPMGNKVLELAQWVKEGGNALFAQSIEKESYSDLIERKMGIVSSGNENAIVDKIYVDENFMVGGGRSYEVSDPFDSAWAVELDNECKVYAWTDDEYERPLIWERAYGEGKFVIDNFGLYEKSTRGFYAASYSLLTDVGVYPVINGSTFYLDDFPSPVPGGDGTYVRRDYNMSISDFYANVWWPDMMHLASQHGVLYTGVVIENYEDETDGIVERNTDTHRYNYFGDMILANGGEIGYHGYNHQPLSLSNVDYGDVLPYNTWTSWEAMENSVAELVSFVDEIFPEVKKSVYVPPSNVLSEEGRQMLVSDFPNIRTIASNFFPGEFSYVQEFEVAEDGIVEQPRVISGAIIDGYMELVAFSELNMHYVNNHFMHPDDLLDEDRGAALGWEAMKTRLTEYMEWLYTSAPNIRNLTGSALSGAVQRFASISVDKTVTEKEISLHLNNFYDEAFLMIRFNDGLPGEISGGTLEQLAGNLYLLAAESSDITIALKR